MGDYFWVSRKTWEISSLPKFIGFNVAVSLSSAVLAFGFRDVSPDTFFRVFFYASIATMAMALVSLVGMLATCDYIQLSEEEQRVIKESCQKEKTRNRKELLSLAGELGGLVKFLLCDCRKKTEERNIVEIFEEDESTESHVSQVERGQIRNSPGTTYGSIGSVPIPIPGYSASASTISSEKDTTTLL